jgi:hypothetical protein
MLNVASDGAGRADGGLRLGIKVPVVTEGAGGPESKIQYLDVGMNIDVPEIMQIEEGRYRVLLILNRSSVTARDSSQPAGPGSSISSRPVLGNFWLRQHVLLRDGQTHQTVSATDPQSGRVTKIDVTLQVVK